MTSTAPSISPTIRYDGAPADDADAHHARATDTGALVYRRVFHDGHSMHMAA